MENKKGVSLLLVAIFLIVFSTQNVKATIDMKPMSLSEKSKDTSKYISKNSDWEEFYKQTSELIKDSWNENYFDSALLQGGNENRGKNIYVDNEKVKEENVGYNIPLENNGEVMVSIQDILDITGAEVSYTSEKVNIKSLGNSVELDIDNSTMAVNEVEYNLDSNITKVDNEIMLPEEVLTKGLGISVKYNNIENSVELKRPMQTMRLIIKSKTSKISFDKYDSVKTIVGPDNIFVLQFDSIMKTQLCYDELLKNNDLEYVEPDVYVKNEEDNSKNVNLAYSTKETYFYNSWGVEQIEADKYGNYLRKKGGTSSVTVGVVDTGVDQTHQFLENKILSAGYDFVNKDNDPYDDNGHGTHVSGTVVDNTQGLNVKILPVKVMGSDGGGSGLNIANGISYAAQNGAEIINFSISMSSHTQYLDNIIENAINSGVVVVVSAGNFNSDTINQCPSHNNKAIVVAATDYYNNKANFSNYGDSVDVVAPGVSIISAYPGGMYAYMSGTSMAAPHITAVAAMYKLDNKSLTPAKIEELVKSNTVDLGEIGFDKYYGYGIPKMTLAIPNYKPLKGISIEKTELTIKKGEDATLGVVLNPIDATDEITEVWRSFDENIIRVINGKLMAVNLGTTFVRVEVGDYTEFCEVKVVESDNYEYATTDSGVNITKYLGKSSNIIIPYEINKVKVIGISDYAFKGVTSLESVAIPGGINKIGDNAFEKSSKLIIKSSKNSYAAGYASRMGIKFESTDEKPIIVGPNNIILNRGIDSNFNTMKDVSAIDFEDGDITSKVLVRGYVDINTVGEYELLYSVIDSDGNLTTKLIGVTVEYAIEDINKDAAIDIKDIAQVAIEYDSNIEDNISKKYLDINNDKFIDIFDIIKIALRI